jgi:hypothetical protein
VNLIFFTHQESIATWIFKQLEEFPEFSSLTCVTDSDHFLRVAREKREYVVLVGQLRTRGYLLLETVLRMENLLPQRRVLSAPIITDEFLRWAQDTAFDGVVDAVDDPFTFGQRVRDAFVATRPSFHIPTERVAGTIPYRDFVDQGIVRLVAVGLTNEEIASRTNLALATVRNRISRLLELSGARNRTHLAAMYLIPYAAEFRDDLSTDN